MLTMSKLRSIADINFIVPQVVLLLCDSFENIVGKGENTGDQHFLHFQQSFRKLLSHGIWKFCDEEV